MDKNIDEAFDVFNDLTTVPIEKDISFVEDYKKTQVCDHFILDKTMHHSVVHIDHIENYECIDQNALIFKQKIDYDRMKQDDNTLPSYEQLQSNTFIDRDYEFPLDTFQKLALSAIERDESVLVSAHTSAGKTVCAEYAISKCLKNKQRCIYTSPIKALSNQKYREIVSDLSKTKSNIGPILTINVAKDLKKNKDSELITDIVDLQNDVPDVGLITGDVTINPNASILVMTTEILRNMLYRGNIILAETHYIIFDEIHYLKDAERGVVWEECIILAPDHFRFIFLSATVPNALEFAEWVCDISQKTIHVIYTERRPTPLEHHINVQEGSMIKVAYQIDSSKASEKDNIKPTSFGSNSNLIVQEEKNNKNEIKRFSKSFTGKKQKRNTSAGEIDSQKQEINEEKLDFSEPGLLIDNNEKYNYTAVDSLSFTSEKKKLKIINEEGIEEVLENMKDFEKDFEQIKTVHFDKEQFMMGMGILERRKQKFINVKPLIDSIIKLNLLPCIIFSFSRKDCEKHALSLTQDFLNDQEKQRVSEIFTVSTSNLNQEEREIPLILNMLPLLTRGIGIHHSGLLPIIKEIIEILFQYNLLKILFATETFSIGLNMPAKSVIFTKIQKFDGEEIRMLRSGEYIQMSGRAGRRGLDPKGVVIAILNEPISLKKANSLFSGNADRLHSAFRLTFNMILNLMRVSKQVESLMERSFFHFQSRKGRIEIGKKSIHMSKYVNCINETRKKSLNEYLLMDSFIKYKNEYYNYLISQNVNVKDDLNMQVTFENNAKNDFVLFFPLKKLIESIKNYNSFNKNDYTRLSKQIQLLPNNLDSYPLILFHLFKGFCELKNHRNVILQKYYKKYLERGRIIDIFVTFNSIPTLLSQCHIKNIKTNQILASFIYKRKYYEKTFDAKFVDTIYDLKLKSYNQLFYYKKENTLNKILIGDLVTEKEEVDYLMELISLIGDKIQKFSNLDCFFCTENEQMECVYGICYNKESLFKNLEEELDNKQLVNKQSYKKSFKKKSIKGKNVINTPKARVNINSSNSNKNKGHEFLKNIFFENAYLESFEKDKLLLKEFNKVYHFETFQKMIQVLRRLEYCDDSKVLMKGRVACEISTADELIITEMMFNGDFKSLPVDEVLPLLSCIIFSEVGSELTSLNETNEKNYNCILKPNVEKIVKVMKSCGLEVDIPTTLKKYSLEMMDVTQMWVQGNSFVEITSKTSIFEGSIIRTFRRLEELLKQMCCAARAIGNTDFENLFALGITKIKRDIVFASSLYI